MADDDDVKSEITLDDFNADEQQPAKAEPSPAPEAKEEAKAEPRKAEDKAEAKGKEEEAKDDDTSAPPDVPLKEEGKAEEAPEDTENKPQGEKLAPKSENRFQKLANENRELREQLEKTTSETYAPQTVEELADTVNPETGQPYTVAQAADVALAQQLQMRDYKERALYAQTVVGTEAYEILNEFPAFNPDTDKYDKELSMLAAQTLEANLVRDPNMPERGEDGKPTGRGTIVDFKQSPKQIYQTLARASDISAVKGEIKGQANTEKQLANVDAASNAAPPNKPKTQNDELLEMWKSDD